MSQRLKDKDIYMKFKLKVRETFDLDKKTTEFIKKIEYVIGAIEHESRNQ